MATTATGWSGLLILPPRWVTQHRSRCSGTATKRVFTRLKVPRKLAQALNGAAVGGSSALYLEGRVPGFGMYHCRPQVASVSSRRIPTSIRRDASRLDQTRIANAPQKYLAGRVPILSSPVSFRRLVSFSGNGKSAPDFLVPLQPCSGTHSGVRQWHFRKTTGDPIYVTPQEERSLLPKATGLKSIPFFCRR